jgi:hypothetical protein
MIARAGQARGRTYDLDTGREVKAVISLEVDPATGRGELTAYKTDAQGRLLTDGQGNWITYRAVGRFHFEPLSQGDGSRMVMGAPRCARCGSPLTLRGDDLCAPCRAAERGQRNRMRVERIAPADVLLARKCCQCSRQAVFGVVDEVTVSPYQGRRPLTLPNGVEIARPLFDRGACVGRRWYCERCFKPPRLLDARGEVIRDIEENTLRP